MSSPRLTTCRDSQGRVPCRDGGLAAPPRGHREAPARLLTRCAPRGAGRVCGQRRTETSGRVTVTGRHTLPRGSRLSRAVPHPSFPDSSLLSHWTVTDVTEAETEKGVPVREMLQDGGHWYSPFLTVP